jgi:glycosyltransferase involved in cell wall biosynthesis
VFLFPSTTETFGNVTLEAMASGLAVVAYDYAAAHELIHHGREGLLARFDDADDFARQAGHNLVDRPRIRALGEAARHRAEQMDWESIHTQFEQALIEIVSHRERTGYANPFEFDARPA